MIMYILRIMGDLAFIYAFAGGISACCGGSGLILPMIIQSVCFGISVGLKNKVLKVLVLLPMALCFILPEDMWADWAVIALGCIYVIYLSVTAQYIENGRKTHFVKGLMSWSAQVDKFRLFIKIYPVYAILMILIGFYSSIVGVSLPMAIVMVMISVLLMRALRHAPQIYMQKKYMLVNGVTVMVTLIAAWLITLRPVVDALLKSLLWLYRTLIAPILIGLAWILGYALSLVASFFSWLAKMLGSTREVNNPTEEMGPPEIITEYIDSNGGSGAFITDVLLAIAIIIGIVVVVKCFLWLGRKRQVEESVLVHAHRECVMPAAKNVQAEQMGTGAVWQVRRWYRRFMQLYEQKVAKVHVSSTSAELEKRALYTWKDKAVLDEIRDIYIRARYAHQAERLDVKRIKALYMQLKNEK